MRAPSAARPPASPPAAPEPGREATFTPWSSSNRRASSRRRFSSTSTSAGDAPFCGPKIAGASRKVVVTSQATSTSAPCSVQPSASRAPSPPSVVADPPTPTITRRQPCAIAAAMSSPVPYVVAVSGSLRPTSARPLARAISTIAVPSVSAAQPASTMRPSGPVTLVECSVPSREPRIAASVPSPPSASGNGLAS